MGVILAILVAFAAVFTGNTAHAEERGLYVAAEGIYHARRSNTEGQNQLGKMLYAEKSIGNGWGVYGQLYHDAEFHSAYAGVTKQIGNVTLGLGAGPAWYLGRTWTTLNPWLYYEDERKIEGLLYAEVYRGDPVRFYKGYLQKTFENNLILGVYGESLVGVGPMVGFQVTESMSIRITVPTSYRPDEGGAKALVLLRFTFE